MESEMANAKTRVTDEEALAYHLNPTPGKIEVAASKPMATQRDLSLAYSPGVAVPVKVIAEDPETAYDYTSKGNMVAVISNGTAILGLGNLGALASKPVMEGKSVLFKRFADVNSIDIELDTEDPAELIAAIKLMGPSFGGINLEDIKAPECFIVEQTLKEMMDIPVFHDDQHGTAVICAAGLMNALHISGKKIEDVKIVLNGAGAAGIACIELVKAMGAKHDNCVCCDTKGVIYKGRTEGMNQWKSAHAADTTDRTLEDAMKNADVFLGVSAKGAVTAEMVKTMAPNPVIFAMANPDPEITPEEAQAARPDAIVATGRSDYPNQINNVLCFPYLFRGALDVRARAINDTMKIACAKALAEMARLPVPDEVAAAYGRKLSFGPEYIIPTPFDPRLIYRIPPAVAKAGMDSAVARRPIIDMDAYVQSLRARMDPTANMLQALHVRAAKAQKTIVFAEGDDERVLRAAVLFKRQGLGESIVVGRPEQVKEALEGLGLHDGFDMITVMNAEITTHREQYTDYVYSRLQRRGYVRRDAYRMVARDRHVFAACMLAAGHADGMVTGATRKAAWVLDDIDKVFETRPGHGVIGVSVLLSKGRTVLAADTLVHELPTAEEFADMAVAAAGVARNLGMEPRVAFVSVSTFGYPENERSANLRRAVEVLDARGVGFEYDGEMEADVALNPEAMAQYPFCKLSGPANILIMPSRHAATVATKTLKELGGAKVIGPIVAGMEKPVKLCSTGASVTDIVNMAVLAACDVG